MRQREPDRALQARRYSSEAQSLSLRHYALERAARTILLCLLTIYHFPAQIASISQRGAPRVYCYGGDRMRTGFPEDSRTLIVAAVLLSTVLSEDRTPEEIGRMAAFFTVLGDTMALLALQPPCGDERQ